MSRIISSKIPKTKFAHEIIVEFAKKMDFDGLVLINDNSLIICSYYKDKKTQDLIDTTVPHFLEVNDTFQRFRKEGVEASYEDGIIEGG